MNADDLAAAIACAAEVSGLPWNGGLPQYKFIDRNFLGSVSSHVDGNGQVVTASPSVAGVYFWSKPNKPGKIYFSNSADKPVMAHEATHYLQDMVGMRPGSAVGDADAIALRRQVEAQAYDVERNAAYDCLNFFGTDWSDRIKTQAQEKMDALAKRLSERAAR